MSRVARENPAVAPAIRDRVRMAAARLGVVLGDRDAASARMLVFLLSNRDVLHHFHARVLVGAESYCSRMGWELVFLTFRYSAGVAPADLHLPQILSRRTLVRAAILAGVNHPNLIQALSDREIPFSLLGNNVVGDWPSSKYDVVYSADIEGAAELTRHMLSQGHTRICFIGDPHLPWFRRCAEGYQRAMREAGLEPIASEIHSDREELGYLGAKSLLADRRGVTAILAGSDEVARGVYAALRESGVPVPDAISVAGFNDTEAPLFQPPLTSVREFPEELGRHLVDFALQRIERPDAPPQQLTIPTQVIPRASVRALRNIG